MSDTHEQDFNWKKNRPKRSIAPVAAQAQPKLQREVPKRLEPVVRPLRWAGGGAARFWDWRKDHFSLDLRKGKNNWIHLGILIGLGIVVPTMVAPFLGGMKDAIYRNLPLPAEPAFDPEKNKAIVIDTLRKAPVDERKMQLMGSSYGKLANSESPVARLFAQSPDRKKLLSDAATNGKVGNLESAFTVSPQLWTRTFQPVLEGLFASSNARPEWAKSVYEVNNFSMSSVKGLDSVLGQGEKAALVQAEIIENGMPQNTSPDGKPRLPSAAIIYTVTPDGKMVIKDISTVGGGRTVGNQTPAPPWVAFSDPERTTKFIADKSQAANELKSRLLGAPGSPMLIVALLRANVAEPFGEADILENKISETIPSPASRTAPVVPGYIPGGLPSFPSQEQIQPYIDMLTGKGSPTMVRQENPMYQKPITQTIPPRK